MGQAADWGQTVVTIEAPTQVLELVDRVECIIDHKLGDDAFIAGGAITRLLSGLGDRPGGDVDVWVNKDLYPEVRDLMVLVAHAEAGSTGHEHSKFRVNKGLWTGQVIDLIPFEDGFFNESHTIRGFDISVCQFACDGRYLHYTNHAAHDLLFRFLRVLRPTYAERVWRYINTFDLRAPVHAPWPEGISTTFVQPGVPGYTLQLGEEYQWLT